MRAGQHPDSKPKSQTGLLGTSNDWQLRVDLGKQLRFPDIVETTVRPDNVLVSAILKKVVILELTLPWKELMEKASKSKKEKYAELLEECHGQRWHALCLPMPRRGRGALQECLYAGPTASWATFWCAKDNSSAELQRLQKKLQDGCGSGGTSHGLMLLGQRLGIGHSQSGHQDEGV